MTQETTDKQDPLFDLMSRFFATRPITGEEANKALDAVGDILAALSASLSHLQGVAGSRAVENLVNATVNAVDATVDDIKSKLSPQDLATVILHSNARTARAKQAAETEEEE
ncbi:MAG: hypothetical protein LKJ47_04950 [Bifidobacteriaceae bacterium]|jgi:hypothetical protein|nr:hypothetical protein [Bifidobacteriaceae bacterium]